MARLYATQKQVLDAIVARLIDRTAFTSSTCYLTDEPELINAPANFPLLTVAPDNGSFDYANFAGGGADVLTENGGVIVSAFVLTNLDQRGHARVALTSEEHGLLSGIKHDILRALLVNWEPEHAGNQLLRNYLTPQSCYAPTRKWFGNGQEYLHMWLTFEAVWDWDLST